MEGMKGDAVCFSYRLPLSCVRVRGSRTIVDDAVLGAHQESASATVGLDVLGDHHVREGEIDAGALTDANATLEWSDDGRLQTGSVAATGQGGRIIAGIVGAGTALAGVLTADPFLALGGSVAGAAGMRTLAPDAAAKAKLSPDEQKVADAYDAAHPDVAASRCRYAALVAGLLGKLGDALEAADGSITSRRLVCALEKDMASARSQLARLDELFKAWRATTITSRVEDYEFTLSLDDIEKAGPRVDAQGELTWACTNEDDAARRAVQAVLDGLELLVTVAPAPGTADDAALEPTPQELRDEHGIVIRWPRHVQLTTYQKKGDKLVRRASTPALIMDAACHHEVVGEASTSLLNQLFGKHKVQMGFSAGGGLRSLHVASSSQAAALADTLGALPGGIATSLEQSKRIVDRVGGLREAAVAQEIGRLSDQIKLKQLELDQAGLAATSDSYIELRQLKRRVELLTQQKALGELALSTDDAATELAELKQQIALLNARQLLLAAEEAEAAV
jgi:hypothetical protein